MSKVFHIATLLIKQFLTEPSNLISMVLVPLLFTLVIGEAHQFSRDQQMSWEIAVQNLDEGDLGKAFVHYLENNDSLLLEKLDEHTDAIQIAKLWEKTQGFIYQGIGVAISQLGLNEFVDLHQFSLDSNQKNKRFNSSIAHITIPKEFTERLILGNVIVIPFSPATMKPDDLLLVENTILNDLLLFKHSLQVHQVINGVSADYKLPINAEFHDKISYLTKLFKEVGKLEAQQKDPSNLYATHSNINSISFNQASIGMLVMFAMFSFLAAAGVTLVSEREEGTLFRFLVMPLPRSSILLGKMLGIFFIGVAQILILVFAGIVLFDVNWGQAPFAVFLVLFNFSLASTGLGILVAAVTRTAMQANIITNVLVMAMCALGGAWWPLHIEPQWMQTLALVFPVTWTMQALDGIVNYKWGVLEILPAAGALMGFAILYFIAGVWKFRFE